MSIIQQNRLKLHLLLKFPSPRGDEYNPFMSSNLEKKNICFRPLAGMSIIPTPKWFAMPKLCFRPLAGMSIIFAERTVGTMYSVFPSPRGDEYNPQPL